MALQKKRQKLTVTVVAEIHYSEEQQVPTQQQPEREAVESVDTCISKSRLTSKQSTLTTFFQKHVWRTQRQLRLLCLYLHFSCHVFYTSKSWLTHLWKQITLPSLLQSWLMNSRDRWGCLFYILKLWTSDTLWFSKLHHQFSPGCSQWGQGCSAHIDLFNISHCMWLQTPIQKAVLSVLNRMQWVQASKPFLLTTVDHMMFKVCCKIFWDNSLIQLLFSLITKLTYCQHPWWLVLSVCMLVCVYACVCVCYAFSRTKQ